MTKTRDQARPSAHLRPGEELQPLEEAARSRSEADWIVGMNATRAATIRLRVAFDGAVSLGRVQTPTLALVARREEEIRAFEPEPYWLVEARFEADGRAPLRGPLPRAASRAADRGRGGGDRRRRARARPARSRSSRRRRSASSAQLLYDLTSLQRDANTRFGFSARRTLAAAQRLYEEHKALTYPRTNSRFLTERHDRRDQADRRARRATTASTRRRAAYVTGLDMLPLGRVVNDAKVTDHHAIIPTQLRARRSTRWATTSRRSTTWSRGASSPSSTPRPCSSTRAWRRRSPSTCSAPAAGVLLEAGWRGVYGEEAGRRAAGATTTRAATSCCRSSSRARRVDDARGRVGCEGDPAAAALLRRLAARRDGDRRQGRRRRRAARGDEGLRHRHAGHARGDHRAADRRRLHRARRPRAASPPRRASSVIRLLGEHPLTSPELTGDWEHRLAPDRAGRGHAPSVHGATSPSSPPRPSPSSTRSSRTSDPARQPRARARSAATTSSRTARATRAGRARTRAAAS